MEVRTAEHPMATISATNARKIAGKLVKKVRDESRDPGTLTRVDEVLELAPNLETEDITTLLAAMAEDHGHSDVRLLTASDGTRFLYSAKYLTDSHARVVLRALEFQTGLVKRVRADSKDAQKPTRLQSFTANLSLEPDEINANLAAIARKNEYADIQSLAAYTGSVYLYSAEYLTLAQASTLARSNELRGKICEKVRGDSKYLAKLTAISSLTDLAPCLKEDEVHDCLGEVAEDEPGGDIKSVNGRDGTEYFFCTNYMTLNYAEILARIEANDPCFTIAQTVRDESRIYPRPTNVELFKYGLWNIDRAQLDQHIVTVLATCEDIKLFHSSTGATYLWSTLFLAEEAATFLAERAENARG